MNAERRKQIEAVLDELERKTFAIEDLENEEQEYYDAMPDSIRDGEKGDKAQEAIDALVAAKDAVNEAIDYLREAMES
jgi:hypothetical protein